MGFYFDDGEEYNPDLHPLPNMCLSCKYKDDESEYVLCTLNRMGVACGEEFDCHQYKQIGA